MNTFTAAYDSSCESETAPDCNGWIFEGDRIAYVNDEIACEACVLFAEASEKAHNRIPTTEEFF